MQTGNFRLHENSFIAGERKLVIKERKKLSGKPKHYLIQVSPFQYISSLFPVSNTSFETAVSNTSFETFTFDFESKLYSLRRTGDKVEIEEIY